MVTRKTVALLAMLALIGAGCGGSGADGAAVACRFTPAPPTGEITFARDGRLLGVSPDGHGQHCLAYLKAVAVAHWAAPGDRALLGTTRALLPAGAHPTGFTDKDQLTWSPAGRSLLAVTPKGELLREPSAGGKPEDLTFLNRHETTLYHPSGRAIVSVGDGTEGYGIYLADTTGHLLATLAEGHTARHIGPLAWTANGDLLFAAQHDDRWDLHRLQLGGAGALTTVASTPSTNQPIGDLVASPFPDGGVAWRQGDCTHATLTTKVLRNSQPVPLPPELATATPTDWLADGTLVLQTDTPTCPPTHRARPRGTVYAFKDGHPTPVASTPSEAAVRIVLPPGPDLPSAIASAGPI
jgi:hypothetical protein